jgi:hypothetical protein
MRIGSRRAGRHTWPKRRTTIEMGSPLKVRVCLVSRGPYVYSGPNLPRPRFVPPNCVTEIFLNMKSWLNQWASAARVPIAMVPYLHPWYFRLFLLDLRHLVWPFLDFGCCLRLALFWASCLDKYSARGGRVGQVWERYCIVDEAIRRTTRSALKCARGTITSITVLGIYMHVYGRCNAFKLRLRERVGWIGHGLT